MSWLNGRTLAIAGGTVGAAVILWPRSGKSTSGNIFNTSATQSIGDRYSAGGGSNTHLPGVATPLGSPEKTISPQIKANGVDSPHFKDTKADQKVGEPGAVGKAFYKAQYGSEKGK